MNAISVAAIVVLVQVAGLYLVLRKIEEAYRRISGYEWDAWKKEWLA